MFIESYWCIEYWLMRLDVMVSDVMRIVDFLMLFRVVILYIWLEVVLLMKKIYIYVLSV